MKIILALFMCVIVSGANARQNNELWNWYYAGFNSPSSGAKLFVRVGTAKVDLGKNKVSVHFYEKDYPELKASFEGVVDKGLHYLGKLKGFFPSGDDVLSGAYRKYGKPSSCYWQEIILRPEVPDGSVLVLSKVEGVCQ